LELWEIGNSAKVGNQRKFAEIRRKKWRQLEIEIPTDPLLEGNNIPTVIPSPFTMAEFYSNERLCSTSLEQSNTQNHRPVLFQRMPLLLRRSLTVKIK